MENENIPSKYKPLSAWAYVGYQLLFSIPVIGIIFLIVFAFNNDNINRRNYARSVFLIYLLSVIIVVFCMMLGLASYFAILSQLV